MRSTAIAPTYIWPFLRYNRHQPIWMICSQLILGHSVRSWQSTKSKPEEDVPECYCLVSKGTENRFYTRGAKSHITPG